MTGHAHGGAGPPAAPGTRVSATRLVITLGGSGAFAGALILAAFSLANPAIEAHRARRLDAAITEVLREPARYDTLYVVGGALASAPPAGRDPTSLERVYLARTGAGAPSGLAIVAEAPGFADLIRVIFGYDPVAGTLLGVKVLESKETPGLGDRIEKDSAFVRQFGGVTAPLVGVKPGAGKERPGEVDLITGATISSRAVVKIINDALERLGPALRSPEARR
jgi:electron transport complex protein RnfG